MGNACRLGVIGILMLGSFVCVASAVRIHFLTELSKTRDITRAMGPIFIWSDLEPCLAIVSACLPHLAPLRHVIRDKISSTFGSRGEGATGGSSRQRKDAGSSSRGPMFTYGGSKYFGGGDKLKLGDHDDEIESTNRVTANSAGDKAPSSSSGSADKVAKPSIHVHTSYAQTTEQRH
ncbi:hypothetical protein F66182_870 [Fusarium sp. NRRL 66182]|nr:hypothetical protein F66182_870 [Fusarium sp. NRRL 66182]